MHCVICAQDRLATISAPGQQVCMKHLHDPSYRPSFRGRRTAAKPSDRAADDRHPVRLKRRPRYLPKIHKPRQQPKVCRKMPRDPGSWYRRSDPALEDAAWRQARMAARALRYARPAAWIAVLLLAAKRNHPQGMARAKVRHNVQQLAVSAAISGDYGSGNRSRPVRQISAAVAGHAERTTERWWASWEAEGLLRRTTQGRLLREDEREPDEPADPHAVLPGENDPQWRHAAEFRLVFPAWLREITDEEIWPYLVEATQLLAARAAAAGIDPTTYADRILPDDGSQPAHLGTVALSLALDLYGFLPVRRGSFSIRPRTAKRLRRRRHTGSNCGKPLKGASRPSPKSGGLDREASAALQDARRKAVELVVRGRIPFLDYWMVPKVAEKLLGLPKWEALDIEHEVYRHLHESRMVMYAEPKYGPGYLASLLKWADPDKPPAQEAERVRQAMLAAKAELAQARARAAARADAAREPGHARATQALALALARIAAAAAADEHALLAAEAATVAQVQVRELDKHRASLQAQAIDRLEATLADQPDPAPAPAAPPSGGYARASLALAAARAAADAAAATREAAQAEADTAARQLRAAAAAEVRQAARRLPAVLPPADVEAWPEVTQPGTGLPKSACQ